MSAEIRQALADAANAVDGINCTPYASNATTVGTAYVRRERTEYSVTFGAAFGTTFWGVCLVMPQNLAAAEKYYEDKVPALVEALSAEMTIQRAEPQRLLLNGVGEVPIAFVTGHREDQ